MQLQRKHKVMVGAAAMLAAAGGGVALASSQSGSPSEESQAVIDDAASQLGISPSKLSDALKKALNDRVDAAVTAGRLTKEEGAALKARIQADAFPLFGGLHRGFGHVGVFGSLDEAAGYLGLTEAQLHTELEGGKSLAQVARDNGKSVDGLVDTLVAAAKKKLDEAVSTARITKAQEDEMLSGLRDRIGNLVNATGVEGPHFRRPGFGFRRFEGPPA
jgi:AraC-like DNA-binding protein